jgi:histone acetyltransferase (RNA polymerase elongator complex component)
MTAAGDYTPLTVDEAAYRTARVMRILEDAGVKILRVGLCESENLHTGEYIAGPNHPAIGEIAASILYYEDICSAIDRAIARGVKTAGRCAVLHVSEGAQSKAAGQRGKNKMMLAEKYGLRSIKIKGSAKLSLGERVLVEFE